MLASMRVARYVILITILFTACAPQKLAGTDLGTDLGTDPAPDLTLTDVLTGAPLTEVNWHYLIGTRDQLEPVWKSYVIGVIPSGLPSLVSHNDAIFLIDPRGRARTLLHASDLESLLTNDLRILLRDR